MEVTVKIRIDCQMGKRSLINNMVEVEISDVEDKKNLSQYDYEDLARAFSKVDDALVSAQKQIRVAAGVTPPE